MPAIDISNLTEDEGHELFHALLSRFGWAGTVFTPTDLRDIAAEQLADDADTDAENVPAEQIEALADALAQSYAFTKLADRLAEHGNELLRDAAINPEDS